MRGADGGLHGFGGYQRRGEEAAFTVSPPPRDCACVLASAARRLVQEVGEPAPRGVRLSLGLCSSSTRADRPTSPSTADPPRRHLAQLPAASCQGLRWLHTLSASLSQLPTENGLTVARRYLCSGR